MKLLHEKMTFSGQLSRVTTLPLLWVCHVHDGTLIKIYAVQSLSHGEAQHAVLQCLALKARDKDQWTRTSSLDALMAIDTGRLKEVIATDKLLSIFDANWLSIDGISNANDAQACLAAAAKTSRSVSLTLQLFAMFMFGMPNTDRMQEDLEDTSTASKTNMQDINVIQILQKMDEIDLASMSDLRYTAYHAAICYTIISHNLTDMLLEQALRSD